jgi:hypothetical protein
MPCMVVERDEDYVASDERTISDTHLLYNPCNKHDRLDSFPEDIGPVVVAAVAAVGRI